MLVFGHDSPEHSEVESEKLEAAGVPLLSILDRSGRSSLAAPFRHVGDAVTSLISAQSLSSNDSEWTGAWAAARGSTTGTRVRPSIAAAVCGPMRFENGSWMTAHLGRIEVVCECGQMWNVHTNTDVATQRCGYKNCLGGQETVRLEHGGGLTEDEIAAVLGSGELATNNLGEFSCDCGRTLAAIDYEYPDSNAPQGMSLRARPQRRVTGGRTHSCSAHLDRKSPLRRGGADSAAFGYPA